MTNRAQTPSSRLRARLLSAGVSDYVLSRIADDMPGTMPLLEDIAVAHGMDPESTEGDAERAELFSAFQAYAKATWGDATRVLLEHGGLYSVTVPDGRVEFVTLAKARRAVAGSQAAA